MANFASALKEEISRIARKEIRQQTAGATKSVAQCEREIAALKRQIQDLQRKVSPARVPAAPKPAASKKTTSSKAGTPAPKGKSTKATSATPAKTSARARFSAKGLKANRERLGLSADSYGRLVGVSGLSIYNWEQGKARPRESSIDALLKIKGIGKREAAKRLEALDESTATTKKGAGADADRTANAS